MKKIEFEVSLMVDEEAGIDDWGDYIKEAINEYLGCMSEEHPGPDLIDFEPNETVVEPKRVKRWSVYVDDGKCEDRVFNTEEEAEEFVTKLEEEDGIQPELIIIDDCWMRGGA